MDIKRLLGLRPKADDSATLRAALAEAEAAIAASRAALDALEARSGVILLDGAPAEVERHTAAIEGERQHLGHVERMAAELPARIAAAEAREATAALDAERAEAERIAAAAVVLLPQILRAARELARLVTEHDGAARHVVAVNRKLSEAGRREDRVMLPAARAWPNIPEGRSAPTYLGPWMQVPGPLGACASVEELDRAVTRITEPAAPLGVA